MKSKNLGCESKKKIVILFLIDFVLSRYGFSGGTEKQLIDKINNLDRKRFTPILICLQKRYHNHIWDKIDCEKIVLHIYSLKSLGNLSKFFELFRILKSRKINIIEAVFFDSMIIAVIIGRLAGVKNIITCRRDMGFWYNKSLLKLLYFINRYTKRVLVNATAIRKQVIAYEKIRKKKLDVIYNGINIKNIETIRKADIRKEFSFIEEKDKLVGIVANLNRYVKRVDLFIKSIKTIILQYSNVKFIVIGDGKLKPGLMALANECKVNDFLIWTGVKIDPIPYIKNFDIGVISSDSEGFCNAIMEYMATGIPVVATDAGGNKELVEDGYTGFLIPPNDHIKLANKILLLLQNKELAAKIGKNGKKKVCEKYSWDKIIKEYEKYYYDIVRGKR